MRHCGWNFRFPFAGLKSLDLISSFQCVPWFHSAHLSPGCTTQKFISGQWEFKLHPPIQICEIALSSNGGGKKLSESHELFQLSLNSIGLSFSFQMNLRMWTNETRNENNDVKRLSLHGEARHASTEQSETSHLASMSACPNVHRFSRTSSAH